MPEQADYGGPSFGGPAPGAPGGPEHSGPGGPGGYGGFPTDGSAADLADLAGALADAIEAGQSGETVGTAAQADVAGYYEGDQANLSDAQDGQDAASPSLDAMGSGMEGYGQGWGYGVDPSGYSYGGYGSGLISQVSPTTGLITAPSNASGMEEVGPAATTGFEITAPSNASGMEDFGTTTSPGYQAAINAPLADPAKTTPHDFDIQAMIDDDNATATPTLTSVWGDNPNLDMGIPTAQPPGALLGENLGTIAYDEEAITEKDITEKGAKAAKEVVKDAKYHTQAYADLAKGYMETLDALRANPQGQTHGINNTTLANAYSTMDQTMKAFTVVHGPSKFGKFVGYLAKAVVPGLSALQAIENSLIAKGMYDNTTGQAMLAQVAAAIASGDHLQGGGGEDQEEDSISNFISQYPWAEGLDPNYIKYLIENPQELQKLLTGEAEI